LAATTIVPNSQSDAADSDRRQGRHGECPKVPGCDTFGRKGEEGDLLAVHPTVKPMAMVAVIDRLQSGKWAR